MSGWGGIVIDALAIVAVTLLAAFNVIPGTVAVTVVTTVLTLAAAGRVRGDGPPPGGAAVGAVAMVLLAASAWSRLVRVHG